MKKLAIKLATFILLSVAISSAGLLTANADAPALQEIVNKLAEDPCIETLNTNGSAGKDAKKIVTIVEEPFGATQEEKNGFEIRQCYRNTVVLKSDDGKVNTIKGGLNKNCINDLTAPTGFTLTNYCTKVYALISDGGTTMITNYISMIYKWAAGLVGLIAVLVIVISAIQISVSGGDSGTVTKAKDRIIKSISGIAVLFLSGLILYTINPNFFTLQ